MYDYEEDNYGSTSVTSQSLTLAQFSTPFIIVRDTLASTILVHTEQRLDVILQHRVVDISRLDTPILTDKGVSKLASLPTASSIALELDFGKCVLELGCCHSPLTLDQKYIYSCEHSS